MPALTLESFATLKRLPETFLTDFGVEEQTGLDGATLGLRFLYRDHDGDATKSKTRWRGPKGRDGKTAWLWSKDQRPIIPFGCDGLSVALADNDGVLHICEGESDTLTLRFHRYAALGIPGAALAAKLRERDLAGVRAIYIWRDNDDTIGADGKPELKGGRLFVAKVAARLQDLNFAGPVYQVGVAAPHKDVSDLHVALCGDERPHDFLAAVAALVKDAAPILLDPQAEPEDRAAVRRIVGDLQTILAAPDVSIEALSAAAAALQARVETARAPSAVPSDITIAADVQMDHEVLTRLYAAKDSTFPQIFGRTDPKLAILDDGEQDFTIACELTRQGFGAQAITDTLIASRRTCGLAYKSEAEYYRGIVIHAQSHVAASVALDRADAILRVEPTVDVRQRARETLSAIFGLQITDVERDDTDDPNFIITTTAGKIPVGTVADLHSQPHVRRRILLTASRFPDEHTRSEWEQIVTLVVRAARLVPLGEDTKSAGEAGAWLAEYAAAHPPIHGKPTSVTMMAPVWIDGDHLFVATTEFRTFLRNVIRTRYSLVEVARKLRALRGEPKTVRIGATTFNIWRFDLDLLQRAGVTLAVAGANHNYNPEE